MDVETLYKYFKPIIQKNKIKATVNIGNIFSETRNVIIEKKESTYYLLFDDPEIIRLLEGHKEYEINPIYFEISQSTDALCTCYGGNHIEIKWL